MRFLYAAISYPDVAVNTNMYTALVQELAKSGHEIRVVAPTFTASTHVANEGGIPVLRVASGPLFKTNLLVKGLNTLLLNRRYTCAIEQFWSNWKMDWVLTSTPPITLSPLLAKLKSRHQSKVFLILRDIFPQNAKDLDMIKVPLLFAYFRNRERHLYRISDVIGCMSPGNMDFLRRQNPDLFKTEKLTYFPNWIRPTPRERQSKKDGGFRERFGLEGKFIALFGGNFGKPQKIEFILDLAERVQHLKDVVFLLIGDGTEKNHIKLLVRQRNIQNIIIYNRIPSDEYQCLIDEADIGLVNLSDKFTIPNIPSRTLGYWDASLPVLAATDKCTDLNINFIEKYDAGLWAETGRLDDYYDKFTKLYHDKNLRKRMGENGRNAVENYFSVKTAVSNFLNQLNLIK